MPHPNAIVFGAARIGSNVTVSNEVTLGARVPDPDFNENARPVVGDNVNIYVGSRVLGGISIGDHAVIGANAVLLTDAPKNATMVGIPAQKVLKQPSNE